MNPYWFGSNSTPQYFEPYRPTALSGYGRPSQSYIYGTPNNTIPRPIMSNCRWTAPPQVYSPLPTQNNNFARFRFPSLVANNNSDGEPQSMLLKLADSINARFHMSQSSQSTGKPTGNIFVKKSLVFRLSQMFALILSSHNSTFHTFHCSRLQKMLESPSLGPHQLTLASQNMGQ